jgi:siroheme synthase
VAEEWVTALAALALVAVTGVLAAAAWRALYQLEEVKRDRHVEVLDAMGRRWESDQMTEALQMEVDHTPESLVRLFERAARPPTRYPLLERSRRRARKETIILLRVPNYFEDAAMIARAGSLESSLVTETFGGVARDEWSLWRPAIKKLQETDPLAYVEFERMAEEAD